MNKDEKEYLLKIINVQERILNSYQVKNYSKMMLEQKELDRLKNLSFSGLLNEKKQQKDEIMKRFNNVVTELQAVVGELKGL